jgi:hypothetical protein
MKHKLFLLLLLVTGLQVQAQQPQLLQERNYLVKTANTAILASAQNQQGYIYYSGTSLRAGRWDNYFLKVKINTDTLWTRKSQVILYYPNLAIQTLPGNNFISGGNIEISGNVAMSLQRINIGGSTVWAKNYTATPSMVTSILVLPNKDLIIGGGYGVKNFTFTRTDSLGNVKWNKGYSWGIFNEAIMDMKFTKTGNILAAGITDKPVGPAHIKLMLVNQNGDSLLGRQLIVTDSSRTETMNDSFSSVTPLSDGGFLVTAAVDTVTAAAPGGTYMGMVVKVDANLHYQWKYIHRNPAGDEFKFTRAKELADGTVIVLGFKIRPIATGNLNSFQFFRFTSQGQLLNVYPFTSSVCTQVWGITLDALPDSTFMIGGRCGNNSPVSYGFYVAKVKIPGLPAVLPPIMPGTVTGLAAEQNKQELYLGQSYPNPTASTAIIPFNLPVSANQAQIIVRDITGRQVGKYELKKNSSNLEVNLSNLHNGLYTYTLVTDGKPIATKKLAVMK